VREVQTILSLVFIITMTQLKTLKDIDISEILYQNNGTSKGATRVNNALRQEAIKWIKEDIDEGDKNSVADLIIKWHKRFDLIIDDVSYITEGDLE